MNFDVRKEYLGKETCRIGVYKYDTFKKWNIVKTENEKETVLLTIFGSAHLANICVSFFSKGNYTKRDWELFSVGYKTTKELRKRLDKLTNK